MKIAQPELPEPNQYLDTDQLADYLNVSKSTIRRWIRIGEIPKPKRLGKRCTRWRLKDIEEWITQR